MDDDLALALALSASEAPPPSTSISSSPSHSPSSSAAAAAAAQYVYDSDSHDSSYDGLEEAEQRAEAEAHVLHTLSSRVEQKRGGKNKTLVHPRRTRAKKKPILAGFQPKLHPHLIENISLTSNPSSTITTTLSSLSSSPAPPTSSSKSQADDENPTTNNNNINNNNNNNNNDDDDDDDDAKAIRDALITMATSTTRKEWDGYGKKPTGRKRQRRSKGRGMTASRYVTDVLRVPIVSSSHPDDPVTHTALLSQLQSGMLDVLLSKIEADLLTLVSLEACPISNTAFAEFVANLRSHRAMAARSKGTKMDKLGRSCRFAFHGTKAKNLPSIYDSGLVIGGTRGVKVQVGRALGAGVYLGKEARVSIGYATRLPGNVYRILACSVIDSPHISTFEGRSVMVARKQALVLPVFLVGLKNPVVFPPPPVPVVKFTPRHPHTHYFPPLAALSKARNLKAKRKDQQLTRDRNAARREYYITAPPAPPTPSPLYSSSSTPAFPYP